MSTVNYGEHETTARLKNQWMANAQAQAGAAGYMQSAQRENFERGLLQQEQQRRAYDSMTQRQGQNQRYGVLAGLFRRMR